MNVSEVRSSLGFANYFRRFIRIYAELARPLDQVTGKHTAFYWSDERQHVFDQIKASLMTAPVLRLADVTKPFRIHTDAGDTALGAVLLQEYDDEWLPVAYASRRLTAAERNYTIVKRETLEVVFAVKSWGLYLFKHFELFTDNQGVVYLQTKPYLSKREIRCADFLAELHISTHHFPGKQNCSDALMRQTESGAEIYSLEFSLDILLEDADEIAKGYESDSELSHIIERLTATTDGVFHDRYFWDEKRERERLSDRVFSSAKLNTIRNPLPEIASRES